MFIEPAELEGAITKDPYNFDFISIREKYDEKELKDALMDNIERFLMELGNGFAYAGREVELNIGRKKRKIYRSSKDLFEEYSKRILLL